MLSVSLLLYTTCAMLNKIYSSSYGWFLMAWWLFFFGALYSLRVVSIEKSGKASFWLWLNGEIDHIHQKDELHLSDYLVSDVSKSFYYQWVFLYYGNGVYKIAPWVSPSTWCVYRTSKDIVSKCILRNRIWFYKRLLMFSIILIMKLHIVFQAAS